MATTPTPRSYTQTLGDLIDGFRSKQGVRALRVGGGILSLLEAAARSDLRSSQDIFTLLNSIALDKATKLALDRIGADEDCPRLQQAPATGTVNIGDSSFTKLSTPLFQGAASPIAGTTALNVTDASLFPNTGAVYIGRGTPNYEGPISYSSKTNAGTHWVLTLASGTTNFHNASENVVLAQGGNRVVGPGTVTQTPQANVASAVQFRTLYKATIPDGETLITGVTVVAQLPGIVGNVIAGAIKEFVSPPFTGATVTNPSPFSNGIETELDDPYRERIRAVRKSRQTGTTLALTNSVLGVVSPDENKRVTSASIVRRGAISTLYIDDGTGYEDQTAGVAIETLVDSAVGGEQDIEAAQRPIARAFAITQNSAPFQLTAGAVLKVKVGGVTYIHSFDASTFTSISNASAQEVVASINSDPNLNYLARTANSGSAVVIFAKTDTNEDIEVVAADGIDANATLGFPLGVNYTVHLYKNDRLLTKDGNTAFLTGPGFSQWNAMSGTQNLRLSIDGTPALNFTFNDQSFIDANTGFNTLGRNTLAAWIAVLNNNIPGVTATEDAGRIVLTSNAGASNRASIGILDGSSLVANRVLSTGLAVGAAPDFKLNRNTSQITLTQALQPGDKLTLGSLNTRAFCESGVISPTTLASTAKLWFVVDGDAEIVSTGVNSSTTLAIAIGKMHDWGYTVTLTASAGSPFANVSAGDWAILWDPALNASLQGSFRIVSATPTVLTVERRLGAAVRFGHRSVALQAAGAAISKVLTTGGSTLPVTDIGTEAAGVTDTCEIFDPNTNTTTAAPPMTKPRAFHTLTVLNDGTVLATGGVGVDGNPLTSMEVFDPITNTWTAKSSVLATAVSRHQATLLSNGSVLITGGAGPISATNAFYVYNPTTDTFTTTGTMTTTRADHKAVRLPNSNVLIVGGYDASATDLATCEIWSTGTLLCSATGNMTRSRSGFGLALVGAAPTTVLAAGNGLGKTGHDSYEIYSIAGGTWGSETTLPSGVIFENKDLVQLPSGNVVGLHCTNSGNTATASFHYDGATFSVVAADPFLTDAHTKWNGQYVAIANGTGSIHNIVCAVGGLQQLSNDWGFQPTSNVEQYNDGTNTWSLPEPGLGSATLTAAGMVVVRSSGVVREVDVPAASNYTASTFAAVINADASNPGLTGLSLPPGLVGASATIYQTNRVRISTNTHAKTGDIALVAQNSQAAGFALTPASASDNLTDHVGAVQSRSELGTPTFNALTVRANTTNSRLLLDTSFVDYAYALVGLQNWWRGADGSSAYAPAAFYPRSGSNYGFRTRLTGTLPYLDLTRIDPRLTPVEPWSPLDRVYLAAPFAIGPNDDLTVTADNDASKRFSIKMWRALAPVGGTYLQTNAFTDADASTGLQNTFGATYDFNDFTVYMAARAVAYAGDSTRSLLFRYYRLGPDGEGARIRFGNPVTPSTPLNVDVSMAAFDTTDITIRLASGGLRNLTVRSTTSLGQTVTAKDSGNVATMIHVLNLAVPSASRTSNVTTLTLTLPPGITDHGLNIGDQIWLQSTSGSFTSGVKTITSRTATQVVYADTGSDGSDTNIGTVSKDTVGQATFSGSSTAAGDFFRFNGTGIIANATMGIATVDANGGYVTTKSGDQVNGTGLAVDGQLFWGALGVATNLQVMTNTPQSATAIAAAINAIAGAANSKCPIAAKVLGAGNGTIGATTPDTLDNDAAWYVLSDGVNWVSTTTLPGSNYQLTFKKPINGNLSTGADWQNEVVHIVPSTTKNVVDWLNTPTVTGLWTACSIQAADDGKRVQIASRTPGAKGGVQVQGGLANAALASAVGDTHVLNQKSASTITVADAAGLCTGFWCRIDNAFPLPITALFTPGLSVTSWTADGLVTFSSPIAAPIVFPTQARVRIERQGDFVFVSDMGMGSNVGLSSASPGTWVRLTPAASPTVNFPQVSSANQGLFRVLRCANLESAAGGGVFIENADAIDESVECTVALYSNDSAMPGDTFVVSTPIWGEQNQGTWTIKAVGETTAGAGDQFAHFDRFTVDVSKRTPAPQGAGPALTDATAPLVYLIENRPSTFIMKIDAIAPNQSNGAFADVRWDLIQNWSGSGSGAGSVIRALDKLSFPTAFAAGADGYSYSTGLIGEANKVVYGDPSDSTTYPGVAADGSDINIAGPLVKRVAVSLLLRIRSGVSTEGIADRVRSAVATVINQTGIGQAIPLSAIVAAASKVVGVISVTVVSPAYGVGNDLIPVQANEKPLVLNLATDIGVTFVGA